MDGSKIEYRVFQIYCAYNAKKKHRNNKTLYTIGIEKKIKTIYLHVLTTKALLMVQRGR